MFKLKPAHEWGFELTRQWKGDYETSEQCRAFACAYDDRRTALDVAEKAGLFPVVESYGTGVTEIRVMPGGVRPPHEIRSRHHGGGRVSGLYVSAA